jgi:hypothetical protein
MGIFNKNKSNKNETKNERQLTESEKKYSDKIKKLLANPENRKLVEIIKYLYLNDTQEFIKQTYPIRLMSLMLIIVGLAFSVAISVLFAPIIGMIGIFVVVFGLFIYLYPFKILSYLLTKNMAGQEKKLYSERYDILRQIYYNEKMYGDAYHLPSARTKTGKVIDTFIDENGNVLISPSQVKNPTTLFRFLVALRSNEKPAFYEKLIDITKLFEDYDLTTFFKNVSERLRGTNFEEYFESQQEENSASYKNIIKEKATIKQSINTMLLLAFAMIGLFIGVGALLQHLLGEIFTHMISGMAGGAMTSSSIAPVFSIFQMITTLPPISIGYVILPIIIAVVIYKLKKDSQEMFS